MPNNFPLSSPGAANDVEPAPSSVARPRQAEAPRPLSSAVVEFTITLPDGSVMTKRGATLGRMIALGREFSVERPHLIAINHPHVSQTHARLRVDDDSSLTIYDAGSTNGTSVGGSSVVGGGTKLRPDGRFHVANLQVIARVVGHEAGPAPSRSSESVSTRPEHAPVTGFWARETCPIELEVARLRVSFWMPEGQAWIGNATACAGTVYFGRFDKEGDHRVSLHHPHVSHDHASVDIDKDGTMSVRDLGSRNGTYVGGVRIHDRTPLGPDGEFFAGDVRVVVEFVGFVSTAPEPAPPAPSPPDGAPPRNGSAWWRRVWSKLSGAPPKV